MQPAIEVRGLRQVASAARACSTGLDLTVAPGEVFALLGPERRRQDHHDQHPHDPRAPRRGRARPSRASTSSATPSRCEQRISLTGQSAAVDDVLTGAENLVMLGRLSGLGTTAAKARATELLERFDLGGCRPPSGSATYSGGMRRRLDLALSFVVTPDGALPRRADHGARHPQPARAVGRHPRARRCRHHGASSRRSTSRRPTARRPHRGARRRSHRRRPEPPTSSRRARRRHRRAARRTHGELLREVPTDGTVSGLRRALDVLDESGAEGVVDAAAPEPRRRVPRPHRTRVHAPPRPSRSSDDHHDPSRPRRDPGIRPRIAGLTAESVFVDAQPAATRSATASRCSMAIMLPVMLMLLFTFVFGDAIDPSGRLRRLRRARHHPAVRRVRRGLHRGLRRARHADRHHRPLPHDAAAQRARCSPGTSSRACCATCSRPAS